MKLKQLASNMTELELNNGTVVLFSYETPVAAKRRVDNLNQPSDSGNYYQYIKTSKKWSVTTSKHINKWLNINLMPTYNDSVDQSVLDNLVSGGV